jgi:DnaK suppressor protein
MEALLWEEEVLERLRTRLLQLKRSILGSAPRIHGDQPGVDRDDLPDPIDVAASEHSQFVLSMKREREASLLRKVEAALRRMATGSYGQCDRCEQDIPPERLEALPVTTLCLDCQEEEELELRRLSALEWRRAI